ncbi:MAG: YihY/virulence factor BrkB family protein [Candidatus Omnitrophota bacterium]|jgi:membrane protein
MAEKILRFFNQDIWRVRARDLKGPRGIGLRTLRIIILSVRQFASDKCSLHASALTFYSLLSIVPVFAMAFGLAKGFGLDRLLKEKLLENTQGQGEVMMRVMEFSEKFLQNTNGGLIAGIGIGLLFWTVINVLASIESSFNDVWGIKKQRTLGRKFADYLSLMLIAPVFFLMASSATVFIASQVQTITAKVAILGGLGTLIMAALQFMPYVIFWALLTYLYMFIPNGKIHFRSALLGGVVAGTIYQFVQWVYIHFQIGVSNAGAIYGSFAALPLFLIWLQLSWRIILYGAELAFAHQNEQTFEFEAARCRDHRLEPEAPRTACARALEQAHRSGHFERYARAGGEGPALPAWPRHGRDDRSLCDCSAREGGDAGHPHGRNAGTRRAPRLAARV